MANFSSRLSPLTVSVPVVTDWVDEDTTGTIIVGPTSNFTLTCKSKRFGDTFSFVWRLSFSSTSTGTWSDLQIRLPRAMVADANLIPANGSYLGSNRIQTGQQYRALAARMETGGTDFIFRYLNRRSADDRIEFGNSLSNTDVSDTSVVYVLVLNGVKITGMTSNTFAGSNLNAIVNGGNSYGSALTIGTNDAFGLNLETNGTTKLSIDTTGGLTASSATTHIFGNSSGAATTGIRIDAAANQDRDIILRSAGVTHFGLRVNTSNACYLLSNSQTINFSGDAGTTIHGSMTSAGAWTLGPSNGNGTSGGASALPHRINGFTDNRGITAGTGPGGGTATCNFDAPFVQGAMYRVVVSVVDNTTPTNWTTRTFDFIENVSNGFGAMNTVNATNGIGTLISSLPISRSGGTLTLTVNVACTNTATIKLNLVRYV